MLAEASLPSPRSHRWAGAAALALGPLAALTGGMHVSVVGAALAAAWLSGYRRTQLAAAGALGGLLLLVTLSPSVGAVCAAAIAATVALRLPAAHYLTRRGLAVAALTVVALAVPWPLRAILVVVAGAAVAAADELTERAVPAPRLDSAPAAARGRALLGIAVSAAAVLCAALGLAELLGAGGGGTSLMAIGLLLGLAAVVLAGGVDDDDEARPEARMALMLASAPIVAAVGFVGYALWELSRTPWW